MKAAAILLAATVGVWACFPAGCGGGTTTLKPEGGPWPTDAREESAAVLPLLDGGMEKAGVAKEAGATDAREAGGGDAPGLEADAEKDGLARAEVDRAPDAGGLDAVWSGPHDGDTERRLDTQPETVATDGRSAATEAENADAGGADAADVSQNRDVSDGPIDAAAREDVEPAYDTTGAADGGASVDGGGGDERIWVYLLAGQSNMMGFGVCRSLTEEDAAAVPGASIYYSDPVSWNQQAGQWLPLAPGFGVTKDYFGPELTFARRIRELHPRRRLAIIKVAEGGTALYDRWKAPSGDLYQLLLREVRTQLGVLAARGRPQLAGLLWMQGESDGVAEFSAKAYQENLTDFIVALRSELGSALLPVVAGLIATDYAGQFPEQVREATREVASRLGRAEVVETDDLHMIPDENVHYDTDGYLHLGHRFAAAMDTMQATRWRFPEDFSAVQGEGCFRYRDRTDHGAWSLAYDDASSCWAAGGSEVAIGKGFMTPGTTGHQAELAFWAPFAGDIEVTFRTTIPNPMSSGVGIEVASPSKVLAGPAGLAIWLAFRLSVTQGDEIFFRTSPGFIPDPDFDTTNWQIDIAMTRVDE